MKKTLLFLFVTVILCGAAGQTHAKVVFKNEFLIEDDGVNKFILDSKDNITTDPTLQFGKTLGQTFHFDTANNWFEFSNDVMAFGSGIFEQPNAGQAFRVNDATNDTTPFLIDENGNMGVKTASPAAPLDVQASGQALELGDASANDITLTFDDGTDRNLTWNRSTLRFDLSNPLNINGGLEVAGNVDFNLNNATEFKFENLAAAPTCNLAAKGRAYQNTVDNNAYVCNGTTFQLLNNTNGVHYHNGALATNIKTATRNGVATTGEDTTIYLTSDGTATGTLLFSQVYNVSASTSVVQSLSEAPAFHGYSYNSGTGALVVKFLENAVVSLLGGQGLEAEEAGTAFSVFVVGI